MPSNYELMRMSELEDEDGIDYDEADEIFGNEAATSWEEEYLARYNDWKLLKTTKLDW